MKKTVLFLIVTFLLYHGLASAHPPSNIKLNYDKEETFLYVEVTHVTNNVRKKGLARLIIYKNNEAPIEISNLNQTINGVADKFRLEAVAGDMIRVRAISNRGEYLDQTLLVK